MCKTVLLAAGGTGGHLFPAQALARDLKERISCNILFAAKGLSSNTRFDKEQFVGFDIHAATPSLKGSVSIARGIFQSLKIVRKHRPDLIIGFGSFHTFPLLVAALLCNIPVVLHEANQKAGRVNRLLSRFAAFTGIFFPDTKLSGTCKVTDIPSKLFATAGLIGREQAHTYYGLDPEVQTVLVFGGSLGAKKLNTVASHALCSMAQKRQVIHFTGCPNASEEIRQMYHKAGVSAVVKEFECQMQYAWKAADVVIARSGASTVSEQIFFEVPALFVPYPHATDDHQRKNATFVQDTIRGAKVLLEQHLDEPLLKQELAAMLDVLTLSCVKENIASYKRATVQTPFVEEIVQFLGKNI